MAAPLAVLLAKAIRSPDQVRSKDGGAALALSLHCLFVDAGFVQLDAQGRPQPGVWNPPKEWNSRFVDEWVFLYRRPGAALRFRLHCSLQAQTRRMFIHASEVDDSGQPIKDNIQVMGLQLDNYVPNPGKLQQRSWEDVVVNPHTLADMAREFVIQPLWRDAEKAPEGECNADGSPGAGTLSSRLTAAARSLAQPSAVLPAVAVAAALAAAALLLWRRQQQQHAVLTQ